MLRKMMQKFSLHQATKGWARFVFWTCILVNIGTTITGIYKGVWISSILGIISCAALTLVYYRILPELQIGWEKLKICWYVLWAKQYYICTSPDKTRDPLKQSRHRCFISDSVSPLFLSACSGFAEKKADETREKYNLVAQELKDLGEMEMYLKSGIFVFWINSKREQIWCYEEKNKILTRQHQENKHQELVLREDLGKHWKEMSDGYFVIKMYERK